MFGIVLNTSFWYRLIDDGSFTLLNWRQVTERFSWSVLKCFEKYSKMTFFKKSHKPTDNYVFCWFIVFSDDKYFRISLLNRKSVDSFNSNLCCLIKNPYAQKWFAFPSFLQIFRLMHGVRIWRIHVNNTTHLILEENWMLSKALPHFSSY